MNAYKCKCKFKKYITEEPFFDVLRENQNNPHSCHCTICDKDVDCSHQWKADIKRHVNGNTHVSKSEAFTRATKASNHVTDFFTSESSADQVINSELLVTDFLVEYDLSMAVVDSLGLLFKKAFPDSKITKQYHCGTTKTCIINDALAPYFLQKTVESMKTKPFTLSTDGSNDTGLAKMNFISRDTLLNSRKVTKYELDIFTGSRVIKKFRWEASPPLPGGIGLKRSGHFGRGRKIGLGKLGNLGEYFPVVFQLRVFHFAPY